MGPMKAELRGLTEDIIFQNRKITGIYIFFNILAQKRLDRFMDSKGRWSQAHGNCLV